MTRGVSGGCACWREGGGALVRATSAFLFNNIGVPNTVRQIQWDHGNRVRDHLLEVPGGPIPTPSSPDTTGSLNSGGHIAQLGPAVSSAGTGSSKTRGKGLASHVTLHAWGLVTGQEVPFPSAVAFFGWVSG